MSAAAPGAGAPLNPLAADLSAIAKDRAAVAGANASAQATAVRRDPAIDDPTAHDPTAHDSTVDHPAVDHDAAFDRGPIVGVDLALPRDPGAILDWDRRRRLGMVEAVWGQHKSAAQIRAIAADLLAAAETVLVTRVDPAKAAAVLAELPDGALQYHETAACLCTPLPEPDSQLGVVRVLGGGSSDLTVASEALLALRCHRVPCELLLDVGVAGLQRLLNRLDQLRNARVLIACAGMEGALPTVLAGLLPQPVIAVPVSVGYGVSAGGVAALHGMLASCAPGLVVVNIDNGYGAAMAALRILNGNG